jgi:hypothetical protein
MVTTVEEDIVRLVRYLVVVAPGAREAEARYRSLETYCELRIGDLVYLDEVLSRVSAVGDGPEGFDSTVIVIEAGDDGS